MFENEVVALDLKQRHECWKENEFLSVNYSQSSR